MSDPAEQFDALVSGVDYPMFIVTAAAGEERSGCLVGFVTQASIDPPRLLVMLSKRNHTFGVAQRATALGVHFLHRGNHDLATLFGEETGDRTDKFEACRWTTGPEGTPLLDGVRGWVVGRVVARLDGGDHVAHVLDTVAAEAADADRDPLTFQMVRDMDPGHEA
jgi:flavin reductase (DIM6/NTAB) family NADH-FMN oxidoreductase RutF